MEIILYGKEDCSLCDAAKDKLHRMGLDFDFRNFDNVASIDNPDKKERRLVMVAWSFYETLPILDIGELVLKNYPEAMKALKRRGKK